MFPAGADELGRLVDEGDEVGLLDGVAGGAGPCGREVGAAGEVRRRGRRGPRGSEALA